MQRQPREEVTILAIDGGKSTGLAYISLPLGVPAKLKWVEQGKWSLQDTVDRIKYHIGNAYPDIVVAEQFDLRPHNNFVADLSPVRINAVLDYLGLVDRWQTPAQAKGLVADENMKNLNMWPTGKTVGEKDANDARDAIRHALHTAVTYLTHLPTISKGWPDK